MPYFKRGGKSTATHPVLRGHEESLLVIVDVEPHAVAALPLHAQRQLQRRGDADRCRHGGGDRGLRRRGQGRGHGLGG